MCSPIYPSMLTVLKFNYPLLFVCRIACLSLASLFVLAGLVVPVPVKVQYILYGVTLLFSAIVPLLLDRAGAYCASRIGYLLETSWRIILLVALWAWSSFAISNIEAPNLLTGITLLALIAALFVSSADPAAGSGYNTPCSNRVYHFNFYNLIAVLVLILSVFWQQSLSFMPADFIVVGFFLHLVIWRYISWTAFYKQKPTSNAQPLSIWPSYFKQEGSFLFWSHIQDHMQQFPSTNRYFLEHAVPSLPLDTLLTYFDPLSSASICLSPRRWYTPLTNCVLSQVHARDPQAAIVWAVYGPDHEICAAVLREQHAREIIPKIETWTIPE